MEKMRIKKEEIDKRYDIIRKALCTIKRGSAKNEDRTSHYDETERRREKRGGRARGIIYYIVNDGVAYSK